MKDDAFVWDESRKPRRPVSSLEARIAELEARLATLEQRESVAWVLPVAGAPPWAPRVMALCEAAHDRYQRWRPRLGWRARLVDFAEELARRALTA